MADEINKQDEQRVPDTAAKAIPEFCPRDGSILQEGVKYGFQAWICPGCTYWKLRR